MWHLRNQYIEPFVWINGVFTDADVQQIVHSAGPAQPGLVANNQNIESIRRSDVAWIAINNDNRWVYQKIQEAIDWANTRYYNYDIEWFENLQLASYDAAQQGCYGQHLDVATSQDEQDIAGLRKLSVTVQLTQDTDYVGGDLKIYTSADARTVPRQRGTVIVFPSFMLHEVTPVTSGCRQSLVTWVHGPRFK